MENLIPVGLFILCLAGAVALLALAYFLYILVKIIRNTVNEKVNPMLDDAADLIKQAKPIVGRVDPLMDRITLTIDGANLQIMRIDQIMEELSEDELDVYKRGRNTNTHSKAKNATMGQYRKATGLEALYGYLYLKGDMERLQYFVDGMIKQYLAGKEQ